MTKALRTQIKNKNAMYADTLQTNHEEPYEKYKMLQSSLKNKEIEYYSNQFDISKNDSSKS